MTELVGKSDQQNGPSKSKINTGPSTSKKDTAPSTKKVVKKKDLKTDDLFVNLPRVNLTQSSDLDLQLGTQKYLQRCLKNLSQDTFVQGFDPSQAKADPSQAKAKDPLDWLESGTSLMDAPLLNDQKMVLACKQDPARRLVHVPEADFGKIHNWQSTRTDIQIGPSMLTEELATRVVSASQWLKKYEIDALMYVFQERTTLQRWEPNRVTFMTCVFSNLIAVEYLNFSKGIRKYKMDPLLLDYGKGELPAHGRTRKVWSVDRPDIHSCLAQLQPLHRFKHQFCE